MQVELGWYGSRDVQSARHVQALSSVVEKAFHGVRQEIVRAVRVAKDLQRQILAEQARVLAVAGDEHGPVDRSALSDADHSSGTGADSFDRLTARIDFFNINSG